MVYPYCKSANILLNKISNHIQILISSAKMSISSAHVLLFTRAAETTKAALVE